jgi:uncharacterized protein YyaL (SSP411 family)
LSILKSLPATAPVMMRGKVLSSAPLATPRHLTATVDWIVTAHASATDGGIPAYYDLLRGCWRKSYPETTGYTIPTLLTCSARLERPDLRDLAIDLANYLLGERTSEGGVAHWDRQSARPSSPIVFDTGQVIFGWLAAWEATGDAVYRDAATAAADWLVEIQDSSGAWQQYQHLQTVKVIDARVAWSLLEVHRVVPRTAYLDAARRNLDWVLTQQEPNGWFRNAGFRPNQDPFTHTIAYTVEGLLESGLLLDEPRYVTAAESVATLMLRRQRPDGSLAASYGADWQPTARSSCLTGNCQLALLWLRLFKQAPAPRYLSGARRAIAYVASTQDLTCSHPGIRGAIAGSFPIYGAYERLKYPNWAAKFFVDALLSLEDAERIN